MLKSEIFDYKHFERLPSQERISAAQLFVNEMFPPNTRGTYFEDYFQRSGAKCTRVLDKFFGPGIICRYEFRGALQSIIWTIGAYLDRPDGQIIRTSVGRYSDGL